MEDYAGGPTIKQVAAATKLPVADVRLGFWDIRDRGLATVYKARDDHALHLAPLGFEYEEGDLSHNQERVLGYLAVLPEADDGTVSPPSTASVHRETGVPLGSLGAVVGDLERKGKIEVVQRGSGSLQKPRYRVVHRQLLQQALGARAAVRDVSPLLCGDPPLDRSALADRHA